jgi:hypothetical protein
MGIKIVDPNKVISEYISDYQSGQPFPTNIGEGPVTTPPEDLVTYVDLEVFLPGRSIIVDDVARQQQRKENIGFVVPKNLPKENYGKLGTSWTNIGGLQGFQKNDDGAYTVDGSGSFQKQGSFNETFGIQDIQIKLNSSFEPQVFITFVDIRGASLMEPGLQSPYAAFFHMPYPLFTLTIKGFYGRGISYKLHLMKFNSRFDNDTGNFIIKCEFIGFTFTYLADMPAIYADVGPDLLGFYGTEAGGEHEFATNFESGRDPRKPWPEGSMTLGVYINNIATLAAKMDHFEDDSVSTDYYLLTDSLDRLRNIELRWGGIASDVNCTDAASAGCGYVFSTSMVITAKELYTDTGALVTIDEAKVFRNVNNSDNYRQLLLQLRGTDKNNADTTLTNRAIEDANFIGYVNSVYDSIDEVSMGYLGTPPNTALINQGDDNYEVYGPVSKCPDCTTEDINEGIYGIGQIDAEEYFKKLRAYITKGEQQEKELKTKMNIQENELKLDTLVMPPTLENVFKLLCNGMTAFQKVLVEVGTLAYTQHNNDDNIKALLLNSGGSDIKSLQDANSEMYAFPLYYETRSDSLPDGVTGKIEKVSRVTKQFPGWKVNKTTYGRPEFIVPKKWPEITLVEQLIRFIIKKQRELKQSWDPGSEEFKDGYIPAIVEETPLLPISPYLRLTDVKKQIIPLLMIRTMMRLGHTNNFPVPNQTTDYPGFGSEDATTISILKEALKNDSATKTLSSDNGGYDALEALGQLEAETLLTGVLDTGKKRLKEILSTLTNEVSMNTQKGKGKKATETAIKLLKEAGYGIESKTVGEYTFVGFQGAKDPLNDVITYHSVMGLVGQVVNNKYEYWLPNIDTKLSSNIFYDTCSDADYAMECKGFYISSVAHYRTEGSSDQQVENLDNKQNEKLVTAGDKLIDWYKTCFGEEGGTESEYSKVEKLVIGPQGTLDYDYKLWLGWDFFSYWSRSKYTEKVNTEKQSNNFSSSNHMSPDQFAPHAIKYSKPTRLRGSTGLNAWADYKEWGWNADRQTFIIEDFLWIKNDWTNVTINNYTVKDDAGNYQYIPYTRAADSSGYEEALDGQGSGVVNPEMASNLALGYLYINNVGKYYASSAHKNSTSFTKKNNLTRFFDQFAGYSVLPEYIVLQIGSWLYREQEVNDLIRWPNYFSSTGAKKNGQWTFMIPKKTERPQPSGDMISAEKSTNGGGKIKIWTAEYRRVFRNAFKFDFTNDTNWMSASDFNNSLWFIGGQCSDWKSASGQKVFDSCSEDYGYDYIGDSILNLAPEIKKQFIDSFIMWATGRPLDTQTYNLSPSFPEIKRALTATVKVNDDLWNERGFCYDMANYSVASCQGCQSPSTPPTPNPRPNSRLWTSFCDRSPVGIFNGPSTYPGQGNPGFGVDNSGWAGILQSSPPVDMTPPAQVGVVDRAGFTSMGAKFFDFNHGISTHTIDAVVNYGNDIAPNMIKRPFGTVNFATRETNMSATTDNYVRNLLNDNKQHSRKLGTFVLPLLYNGYVNNQRNRGQENFNGKKSPDGNHKVSIGTYKGQIDLAKQRIQDEQYDHWQDTMYHSFASAGFNYFFLRKASHTDRIVSFKAGASAEQGNAGTWDWPCVYAGNSTGCPPPSEQIQIKQNGNWYHNDSYNGFPEVGQEVYLNIHYRNPIRSQWYSGKMEETDNFDYAGINYEQDHPFLIENGIVGGVNPGNYGKPSFYIPKTHYTPNYTEQGNDDGVLQFGNETPQTNELYQMLETFMKNRVAIKNVTWRQWVGVGSKDPNKQVYDDFSTIFTSKDYLTRYFDALIVKLVDYVNEGDVVDDIKAVAKEEDLLEDNDIKLDTYLTLKNIHDKWLTGSASEGLRKMKLNATYDFDQGKESWLYSQFSFVDRAYTDIKHKIIDPTPLLNLKENPKISLYTLIYDLIAHNQFEFFPLPTTVDFSSKNFEKSFIPHLTVDKESIDQNPRFYVMYMGGFSDSLDMDDKGYEFANDGFDITEDPCLDCPADFYKGEITTIGNQQSLPNAVLLIEGQAEDDGGFRIGGSGNAISIPSYGNWVCVGNAGVGDCKIQKQELKAFAVNYAQDNQNFFKSIALDQAEFQETQESLLVIDALSHEEGTTKDPMLKGQNLLNVYQKRSYTCKVDAFGMMSILPLQYFQLNNVPMFHGAYIITNVEHSVTQGDVSTSFEGVRISQSVIPYVSSFLTAIQDDSVEVSEPYDEKLDTRDLNVLSGDVERVGVWFERNVTKSRLKEMKSKGINSVSIELESSWAETSGGSTRWQSYDWDWQPYRQFPNGKKHKWTKRARYSLDGLKEAIKLLSEEDMYVTIMLYFNPNYNYIEPMCGGSGVQSYVKKDYASEGLDTPFTLPELVNELNNYCTKCKVDAVEFDLEGHYRKTRYSSGWKSGSKPLGYNDEVNKKDLAKAVMKKLRDTLPGGTEIGTTVYVGRSVSTNENYWKDPATPEYSCIADYVAVQAYTHAKCKPKKPCKSCTQDSDCGSGASCVDQGNGKGKRCYNDDYNWGGYAGPGKRQKYSGNTIKKISESNFNGSSPTDGKPYLIMGLAGYHQKFADHTISEALVEAWNGGIQPITSSSYGPKEVRYWSYANVFGNNGGYDWSTHSGPVADFILEQTSKTDDNVT